MALLLNAGDTVSRSYSYTQPSPLHPSLPQGCGERTTNLCDESAIQQGYYGALGSYSVFTADTKYRCFKLDLPAGIYTLNISADEDMYILRCSNSVDGAITVYSAPPYTFTLSADATIYVSWRNTDTTNSFTNMKVMLNSGSQPLPYEPFGIKIPISSANTTTPVYLGEVESTRRIKKLVLTGQEDIVEVTSGNLYLAYDLYNAPNMAVLNIGVCTHYPYAVITSTNTNVGFAIQNRAGNTKTSLLIRWTDTTTATDFKAYLAQQYSNGTPVTVWYVLATEETGIVNEPLMKIGEYADTLSNISIPVTAGGDTLSVGTTVQPSEVTVNYKGWHPVADVHERDNGAWT